MNAAMDTAASHPPSAGTVKLRERLDGGIERFGESLNPILVKESRQALKSNQFLITFTLLLACAWGWSTSSIQAPLLPKMLSTSSKPPGATSPAVSS